MGPDTRFGQFDFRDLWGGVTDGQELRWHLDRPYSPRGKGDPAKGRSVGDPNMRFDCTYLCAIHYLFDVGDEQPCFCVAPNTHHCKSLDEAREKMGDDLQIAQIRGPAGTVVLYNIAIQHTRVPGKGRRLTQHNYFSRDQSDPLTNWVIVPQRLTEHTDEEVRTFYSQWSDATKAFAAAGYSDEFYQINVMDKPT